MSESYAFPASFAQEVLWLLDRAHPGLTAYSVPRARRLTGRLDVEALRSALGRLIARHEILRTTYRERDGAVQQIVAAERPTELETLDLSALPQEERVAKATELVGAQARRSWNLDRDLLLRSYLIRLADDDHVLVLTTHHIASDGWSGAIMFRELFDCYEAFRTGREPELPDLPIQYGDFAAWQRDELSGDRLEMLLAYWRTQLAGPLPVLSLPTDRPRPAAPSYEGDRVNIGLDPALVASLRELGHRRGASLYMVLLAAYQALLSRWSGQEDILVGSPIANRERPETEGLIGYVANTLVLRARLEDDPTFTTRLDRVRATCLDAYEHQDVPLETLAADLREAEHLSDGSLYRAVFTQVDDANPGRRLPELDVASFGFDHGSVKFDFTLFLIDRPEGVRFSLHYRTDLFERDTAARFLGHLTTLLAGVVQDADRPVSRLPLLTTTEAADLARWNDTTKALGAPATIAALIAGAPRRPTDTAVVCGEATLTWGEFLTRSSQIAHLLQERGVGPEDRVGLCLERSTDLICGMTGILLAGGAYVPLLPDQPAARLSGIARASGLKVIITTAGLPIEWPAETALIDLDRDRDLLRSRPGQPPPSAALPEHAAYVLFTSGSTGEPKGVVVTHANLVHYVRAIADQLGLPLDRTGEAWHCASVSTLAADLGHTAVFPALASGGVLHLLPDGITTDPARFQSYAASHPIDLLKITPSHLRALLGPSIEQAHLPRRWLVLGGEACPRDLTEQIGAAGGCRVMNHYGPTETTVGACTYPLERGTPPRQWTATVPIGKPIANMRAEVRDSRGQCLPIGIPGELWLGGLGVARGYLGRDDLTAARFVADERIPGLRWYRTGDRVRRLPTGDLEFLGRIDTQVKMRGYRVELEEIEAVLGRHPSVQQAVVALQGESLIGYFVAAAPVEPGALRSHLEALLPAYMIPAAWVRLERTPLTPNGKVDRAALPPWTEPGTSTDSDQPSGETEIELARLWADILKRDRIGRTESFFALGGHSLLAIRLLGRIAKQYGTRLALRTLFEHPTIAELALVLKPPAPLEAPLAAIWAEVLKQERVARDANFFALGGHSLSAIRMLGRVAKQFGVRLSLRTLFEAPTVAELAEILDLELKLAAVAAVSNPGDAP